jgi:hypothetical protein
VPLAFNAGAPAGDDPAEAPAPQQADLDFHAVLLRQLDGALTRTPWGGYHITLATEQFAAYEAEMAERHNRWMMARAEAERLLLSLLSPAQAATYREHGFFDVISNRGNRWRINANGQINNVMLMGPDDRPRAAACAHPYNVADPAAWLTQALTLIRDEDGFIDRANVAWAMPSMMRYAP